MGKSKLEVTGGMEKNFISKAAKSKPVASQVEGTYKSVFQKLDAKAKAKTRSRGLHMHYAGHRKPGAWGATWILWATSPVAQANHSWFKSAISSAKNTRKR